MKTKNELSADLSSSNYITGDMNHSLFAYAGPIADQIVTMRNDLIGVIKSQQIVNDALLLRVECLEARSISGAKIQVGSTSLDTSAGFSVSDMERLARILKS